MVDKIAIRPTHTYTDHTACMPMEASHFTCMHAPFKPPVGYDAVDVVVGAVAPRPVDLVGGDLVVPLPGQGSF